MLQKLVNVLAVASAAVSVAVVGSGVYVYLNKDAIIDNIKKEALGGLGGIAGGAGGALAVPPIAPTAGLGLPTPGSPL
tara:strand:- start:540 stop:773 length:234 start_codon:yes stop_codon:yes gene_type:complete